MSDKTARKAFTEGDVKQKAEWTRTIATSPSWDPATVKADNLPDLHEVADMLEELATVKAASTKGISLITTLTKLKPTESGIETRYPRCVGYLFNQEEAIEAVKANAGDINEAGYYPFCVVETLGEGIYPNTISTVWFEWDQDKGGYQEIDGPPKDLKGVCGFSIG
ncbi:hypothetical protein [Sulfitobacter sp. R18_1]|uniref:hypothetical protein n=1 Tax=Sulfitobacter sp. R18_1 TaxID=2821104 RepID=UPI001ADBE8F8|nr:hypothetical protein [Sulfitobacter sp. R18_1]MBO9428218.1 hypothetical protein [Sulfitobacter sp. R18_1]